MIITFDKILDVRSTLIQEGDNVLAVKDIDWCDPLIAFKPFSKDPIASLLHSDGSGINGQWSYILASPFEVISTDNAFSTSINGCLIETSDPFKVIRNEISKYKNNILNAPAPFFGGAVGFLGYELSRLIENLPPPKKGSINPAMTFGFFDVVVAFDHIMRKGFVLSSGFPEKQINKRVYRANQRLLWMTSKIGGVGGINNTDYFDIPWEKEMTKINFEEKVKRTISYIHEGDIFQANITQRFLAKKPPDLNQWELFVRLRKNNPSPFGAYFSANRNFQILSSSPERFLKLDKEKIVEARPIKGTRGRSKDMVKDKILAKELLESKKDKAENLMIVDLMRNDLAKVCELGSINVPECCILETFHKVHHLTSSITGKLKNEKDAIDLLYACFPGGSVTGAPKVRAMEIIHEIEEAARGAYCGAMVQIGFDGCMDSSILIRSIIVDGKNIIAQSGGGIVSDSIPDHEYEESLIKIQPLLLTLKGI